MWTRERQEIKEHDLSRSEPQCGLVYPDGASRRPSDAAEGRRFFNYLYDPSDEALCDRWIENPCRGPRRLRGWS
jgi:hypothetical protein